MKLKLLFLSLICLNQIDLHSAASDTDSEPDTAYGSDFCQFFYLSNKIEKLEESLEKMKHADSCRINQLQAEIDTLQRQNAALRFALSNSQADCTLATVSLSECREYARKLELQLAQLRNQK